jgi:hypothetical protein
MPKIAISYRRADSRAIVGRIFDRLAEHFGEKEIFIDIDNIPYGIDFRDHVEGILRQVQILIVVVGVQWLGPSKSGGAPRIFDEADPVRIELQTALSSSVRIIPVLVEEATMPQVSELPASLKQFSFRNALRVDSGVDFKIHITRLIGALEEILAELGFSAPTTAQVTATAMEVEHFMGSADENRLKSVLFAPIFARYLIVPTVLLLLAHYLIVIKLNLDAKYLRMASIIIPMLIGCFAFWRDRLTLPMVALFATGTALMSVAAMQVIVALIDHATILPSTPLEWQDALEFLASIILATSAGTLIARMLKSVGRRKA